jgi:hypothetical protein
MEWQMASDNDPDRVGFRSPPLQHRFKPGQSGNPKGRPKGTRNFKTELDEILGDTIQISIDGENRQLSRQQFVLLQLWERAAGKDLAATRILIGLIVKLLAQDKSTAHTSEEHLSESDQTIVQNFLRRHGLLPQTGDAPTDVQSHQSSEADND